MQSRETTTQSRETTTQSRETTMQSHKPCHTEERTEQNRTEGKAKENIRGSYPTLSKTPGSLGQKHAEQMR